MANIEKALLECTGEKPCGKSEKRKDYLKRMVKAAEAVDEKLFDAMPQEAQDWANAGIRADDKGKTIEDFPDADAGEGDNENDDNKKEATMAAATATKNKPAETKKPAAEKPAPKAAAAPKEAKKRGTGKVEAVLGVILKNPSKKAADLVALLKEKELDVTASTVSTVRSDFIRAVNFLDSKGLLTKNPFA